VPLENNELLSPKKKNSYLRNEWDIDIITGQDKGVDLVCVNNHIHDTFMYVVHYLK
jgi:hypothetical protein